MTVSTAGDADDALRGGAVSGWGRRVRVVPKPWFPYGWEVQRWRWWWPIWTSDGCFYLHEFDALVAAYELGGR